VADLSDYKKISVVLKNRQVFDEHYIFICLSQTRWSIEHTHKQLFFFALKSLNMMWSATTLHMVNYHIWKKDQPHIHAIALEKFLCSEMQNLGKWGNGHSVSWISTWLQPF